MYDRGGWKLTEGGERVLAVAEEIAEKQRKRKNDGLAPIPASKVIAELKQVAAGEAEEDDDEEEIVGYTSQGEVGARVHERTANRLGIHVDLRFVRSEADLEKAIKGLWQQLFD